MFVPANSRTIKTPVAPVKRQGWLPSTLDVVVQFASHRKIWVLGAAPFGGGQIWLPVVPGQRGERETIGRPGQPFHTLEKDQLGYCRVVNGFCR